MGDSWKTTSTFGVSATESENKSQRVSPSPTHQRPNGFKALTRAPTSRRSRQKSVTHVVWQHFFFFVRSSSTLLTVLAGRAFCTLPCIGRLSVAVRCGSLPIFSGIFPGGKENHLAPCLISSEWSKCAGWKSARFSPNCQVRENYVANYVWLLCGVWKSVNF